MNKRLSITYLLILSITFSSAQTTYFNKKIDGHLISEGATNILYKNNFYFISGSYSDSTYFSRGLFFMKTDSLGNNIYRKNYLADSGNIYTGYGNSFISTLDSGFALGGGIQYSNEDVGLLVRLNSDCDTLWTKIFKDTIPSNIPFLTIYSILEIPGNGFILTGQVKTSYIYNNDIIVIKTDYNGNEEWRKQYGNSMVEQARSIISTSDGGFLIGGYRYDVLNQTNGAAIVFKIDSLGNKKWQNVYDGPYSDYAAMVYNSNNNSYIIGTIYTTNSSSSAYEGLIHIIKIDSSGNEIWNKKFCEIRTSNSLNGIITDTYGNIIAGGYSFKIDSVLQIGGEMGWILKLNTTGDSLWYREYEYYNISDIVNRGFNYLFDIDITKDKGIVACGYTSNYSNPQSIWILKVDSLGCDTPGCQYASIPQLESHKSSLKIYPNPTFKKIHIHLESGDRQIDIFNPQGQLIYQEELKVITNQESKEINLSRLPNALYLIKITGENGVRVGKVVKN